MTPSIDSARSRLFSAIDSRTHELIATVAELVREPSVLGNEAGVQQVVARHLTDAGMRVESYDLPGDTPQQSNGGNSGVPFAGRPKEGIPGRVALPLVDEDLGVDHEHVC